MKTSVLFLFSFLFAQLLMAYDIDKIRLDYIAAVKNSKKADIFYKELKAITKPDALVLAYLGSAEAIRAKHAFNPINKLAYLKQGTKTLNNAVNASPNNIEVRFLRFSLEHYVPTFLGYSKNLTADKEKIIELLQHKNKGDAKDVNPQIAKNMIKFLLETKRCSPAETTLIKKL